MLAGLFEILIVDRATAGIAVIRMRRTTKAVRLQLMKYR